MWRAHARRQSIHDGMPLPRAFDEPVREQQRLHTLGLADVSASPRCLVKGSAARELLTASGLPAPDAWFAPAHLVGDSSSFVARTGTTEFFVEGRSLPPSDAAAARVYPKYDGSLLLCGSDVDDLLAEVLNVPAERDTGRLTFTQLAAVSCAVRGRPETPIPCVQIWVDATYGAYVAGVFVALAEERGGGWVGLEAMGAVGLLAWDHRAEEMQ